MLAPDWFITPGFPFNNVLSILPQVYSTTATSFQIGGPPTATPFQIGGPPTATSFQIGGPPTATSFQIGGPPTATSFQIGGPPTATSFQIGGPPTATSFQIGGPPTVPGVPFNAFALILPPPDVGPVTANPIFAFRYALIGFDTAAPTLNGGIDFSPIAETVFKAAEPLRKYGAGNATIVNSSLALVPTGMLRLGSGYYCVHAHHHSDKIYICYCSYSEDMKVRREVCSKPSMILSFSCRLFLTLILVQAKMSLS